MSVTPQLLLYNRFDRINDLGATQFLIDSLDLDLANIVEDKMESNNTFPIVWLRFIKAIQSTSVERYKQLKTYIQNWKPTDYAGQDLKKMSKIFVMHPKLYCQLVNTVII